MKGKQKSTMVFCKKNLEISFKNLMVEIIFSKTHSKIG